jgi:hypothetical protein
MKTCFNAFANADPGQIAGARWGGGPNLGFRDFKISSLGFRSSRVREGRELAKIGLV